MRTVGVDLAAEAKKTAVAIVEWSRGAARLVSVDIDRSDESILAAADGAAKVGIDAPFGWPEPFIDFITAHRDRGVLGPHDLAGRKDLVYRLTDRVIIDQGLGRPLSVSADLIGHAAMRAAGLLALLGSDGYDVNRAGGGLVAETYPAAALRRWELPSTQYKGATGAVLRSDVVSQLQAKAPWFDLGDGEALCRHTDDALDAVVCALTARAAVLSHSTQPTAVQRRRAETEGWIVVPTCDLAELVS